MSKEVNKMKKDDKFVFIAQLVTILLIVLYFLLIPILADETYRKGINYREEYKIQDITKDTVR